jgi:hypothetical protein
VTQPDETSERPEDGVIGMLPDHPGPTGTGTGTDAGADPDAPGVEEGA